MMVGWKSKPGRGRGREENYIFNVNNKTWSFQTWHMYKSSIKILLLVNERST